MEAIEELFENPDYKDDICYTPLKLYTDANKMECVYNKAWTSDLWHELVVRHVKFVAMGKTHPKVIGGVAKWSYCCRSWIVI